MSGYNQIQLAQQFARQREVEYKAQCVTFLRDFCTEFARFLGLDSCGTDRRVGTDQIEMSSERVSYVDPPFFNNEDASVWTTITVRGNGKRGIDVGVWHYGDTFLIRTLKEDFDGCERTEAFAHIKDVLIQNEDDLDSKLDWLTRD